MNILGHRRLPEQSSDFLFRVFEYKVHARASLCGLTRRPRLQFCLLTVLDRGREATGREAREEILLPLYLEVPTRGQPAREVMTILN